MNSLPTKTLFFSAGESSGDLHGARLIRALREQRPDLQFVGHGGDRMQVENMTLIEHTNDLAIMGFAEVIKHLPYMLKVMGKTLEVIEKERPQRVILIDYPGFNLRLAKQVHRMGIPVTYFILPQVWAWKENRVKTLHKTVDQALCIFPFEQDWFEEHGVPANYVGHPFSEPEKPALSRDEFCAKHDLNPDAPVLTLLPGSRQQEIDRHWPVYLETVNRLRREIPELQVIVGQAPAVKLDPVPDDFVVERDSVRLTLLYGTAALVASGTATLEAAVNDIPMVVCYKLSPVSWWLARRMTHVPFASMVNLIAKRQVVPEYLQSAMKPAALARALKPLLATTSERKTMLTGLEEVRRTLGIPGVYERAAEAILSAIE